MDYRKRGPAPGRHKLFYGWWVLGACFLITLYVGGVVYFGFTAALEPIATEFGWSYAQISLAASLRGIEIGILAPLLGIMVDRLGPKRLIFGGSLLVGLGLVLVSRINSLAMFYGAFALVAIGISGVTSTVLLAAVLNWFHRKASIVTGILISGFALGGILVPLVTWLIDRYEWRNAILILGVTAWIVALPLSLLVRHKPEQYGYLPDGEANTQAVSGSAIVPEEITVGAGEKTPPKGAFWYIAAASVVHMLVVSAVITHVMPALTSTGISRPAASLAASSVPIISIAGRLGFGWYGDRADKRKITGISFVLITLGLVSFGFFSSGWSSLLIPFLVLFGVGWGGSVTMRAALIREYFGRKRFGTIYGFIVGFAMVGNIAGAPLAGWIFDTWKTYQWAWFILSVAAFLGTVLMLSLPSSSRSSG